MKPVPIKNALEHLLRPDAPMTPPVPVRKKRTLGDIYTTLEAQRIFSPDLPSVAKPPSAPPANQQDRGTASAMSMEGSWGGPEETGEK